MEVSTNLGRVALVPRGEFHPDSLYKRLDVVRYDGAVYLVLRDVQGVTPVDGSDFMLLVENGTPFKILGRFDTLDALTAAHPTGRAGDAYIVEGPDSNTIYLWSADALEWQNIGPLQGPPGPAGPTGSGEPGPPGPGVPKGGSSGQVLAKRTGSDFDTEWVNPTGGLPEGLCVVKAQASIPEGGTVSGGGLVFEGVTASVTADCHEGFQFLGWKENGNIVAAEREYTFLASQNRTLTADFVQDKLLPWQPGQIPNHSESFNFSGAAFGNGAFVAVTMQNSYIAYSTDGKNWTAPKQLRNPQTGNSFFEKIVYGNGKFVVLFGNGQIRYSSDGIIWSESSIPVANASFDDMVFGDNVFVVLGTLNGVNIVVYSEDAKNWTKTDNADNGIGSNYNLSCLAYGNGIFLTMDTTYGYVFRSTDGGKVWERVSYSGPTGNSVRTCYGRNKFVSITSSCAYYSEDGSKWGRTQMPLSDWYKIAYGNGLFVTNQFYRKDGVAYSIDGIHWTVADKSPEEASESSKMPYEGKWACLVYGKKVFASLGSDSCAYAEFA